MDLSNFKGNWVGFGRGAQFARAKVRVSAKKDVLRVYGIGRTSDGNVEVFFFEGRPESETKAVLNLVDYISDNPLTISPRNAHIIVDFMAETDGLEIKFATDVGTHGYFQLRRAKLLQSLTLKIPSCIQAGYRHLKYYFRVRFRHFYLLAVLVLTVCSIVEKTTIKIGMVEAVLLILPLIFLYGDEVRGLFTVLALRKAGPFEFESQLSTSSHVTVEQLTTVLQDEFGEQAPQFFATSKFLVPRTKAILRLMVAEGAPLSKSRLYRMAAGLGVKNSDLEATISALEQTGCISAGEGEEFVVQDIGKQFLQFEYRLEQLYQTA